MNEVAFASDVTGDHLLKLLNWFQNPVQPPLRSTPVTQLWAVESENDKDDSSFEICVRIGDTSSSPQLSLFSSKCYEPTL